VPWILIHGTFIYLNDAISLLFDDHRINRSRIPGIWISTNWIWSYCFGFFT